MPRSAASGRVNRSAVRWQRPPTTRIDGHLTRFNLHFVEIGAQVREHEHTRRDDGDGRRSPSDRRWKRLDERFGLGASKDTVAGRARAKVPRLDLLMKPLRPAGPPANRDVAGSHREPAAQPGHIGLAKRPDLAPRGGPWATAPTPKLWQLCSLASGQVVLRSGNIAARVLAPGSAGSGGFSAVLAKSDRSMDLPHSAEWPC